MNTRPVVLQPHRTVVTNFETRANIADNAYEKGVWILSVCSSDQWLSCALSNGDIKVFDNERLQPVQSYTNTQKGTLVTDLQTGGDPHMLISSRMNGEISLYDVRQSTKPAHSLALPKDEGALSVSLGYDGVLAAVGGVKAHVHFFDVRNAGSLLGTYQDSHTEEVTRVRFQSKTSSMLISASEDGLSCIFDTSQPSEELALKSVLNIQTPLREVGFFGPSLEGVYCLTGSETLSVWHHDSAQRICDFGLDVRSKLSQVSGGIPIDYLVNCFWNVPQQKLLLLAGNHSGDGGMFKVDAGTISIEHLLQGGHQGDIRSGCTLGTNRYATVGEDARLCEWNSNNDAISLSNTTEACPASGPMRRSKKKTIQLPY